MSEICGSPRYYALVVPAVATDAALPLSDDRAMSVCLPGVVSCGFSTPQQRPEARS
ncbi:hypothetical protein XHV734_3187 [Xanthomonas hortorum pv. vitians]|nr:hypothetical protein XHV734_3187 [Xanthomonas hortorum pv. vitians]